LNNTKRYFLINSLVKQYDGLHAKSEEEQLKANILVGSYKQFRIQFLKTRNLQIRARWVLQTAKLIMNEVSKEKSLIKQEKVEFT